MSKYILGLICVLLFSHSTMAEKPVIVATASMFKDMAEAIVGDRMEVKSIVPIGSDPHLHEGTPRDARLVTEADLILINGLTFEGWLDELVENSGTKAKSILITQGISPIESLIYEGATDPHAWMDASYGLTYIKNIYEAVIALDPEKEDEYTFNYKAYKKELEDLDQYIKSEISKIPAEQRVLITSHDAFQYYGRRYGLQLESIVGISTEAEAQTSDIIRLGKVIKETGVPALFMESTINPKLLEQLAKDNKITIGGKLFADSLDKEGEKAGTYTGMLKQNTDVIVAALTNTDMAKADEEPTQGNSNLIKYLILGLILLAGFFFVVNRLNK